MVHMNQGTCTEDSYCSLDSAEDSFESSKFSSWSLEGSWFLKILVVRNSGAEKLLLPSRIACNLKFEILNSKIGYIPKS